MITLLFQEELEFNSKQFEVMYNVLTVLYQECMKNIETTHTPLYEEGMPVNNVKKIGLTKLLK